MPVRHLFLIPLLIAGAALMGCATGPDITTTDDMECQSYGAAPGSQAYFQCRLAKDQQREQTKAALLGAYIARH